MADPSRIVDILPTTWSDIEAALMIFVAMIGGIAWGLKLEFKADAAKTRLDLIEHQMGNGILPVTEERFRRLEEQIAHISRDRDEVIAMVHRIEDKLDKLFERRGTQRGT